MKFFVDGFNNLTQQSALFFQTYSWLINTSVYLSVTAVVILLFKRLFKNKLSARWHFLVWTILIVRFAVPVLPSTPVSLFNAITVDKSVIERSSYQPHINKSAATEENSDPNTDSVENDIQKTDEVKSGLINKSAAEESGDHSGIISVDMIVVFIWLGGAAILAGFFITVFILFSQKLRKRRRDADNNALNVMAYCKEKLNIKRNIKLFFADTSPMIIGLIKPSVYVPDTFNDANLEATLLHELNHFKHADILWTAVAAAVLCLNWFNPIIWFSFFIFKRDVEVYCDARTIKYTDNKKSYAMLLLKTTSAGNEKFVLGTTSFHSGKGDVKRRINFLAKFKKPRVWITAIAIILVTVIAAVCLTNGMSTKPETEKHYDDSDFETSYAEDETITDYFDKNPNIGYEYNEDSKTLTIMGTGRMEDFDYQLPWYNTPKPVNVVVNDGITRICNDAFSADIDGNTGTPRNDFQYTKNFTLPDSVTEIGSMAFYYCRSLEKITLPKNLLTIGEMAFSECHSLKKIVIPDGVTSISNDLFVNCKSLEEVVLGNKTIVIGNMAFVNANLKAITLPDTLKGIGWDAFCGNESLKEISIPEGVESIGDGAFEDTGLTSVTIPRSVKTIGDKAFGYSLNSEAEEWTINKDFIIYGYDGTAAEKYAKENGITFISL